MVYLFNTNLKNQKKVIIALNSIYGIGERLSAEICDQLGITHSIRLNQLSNKQIEKLATYINKNTIVGSELKQQRKKNKNRLIKIACYRGFRHTVGLPARGQRTHSNSKTSRKAK